MYAWPSYVRYTLPSLAVVALQGDEVDDGGRGEQRFRSYDQTDQRGGSRHPAMNFNGRRDDAAGDARARNQLAVAGGRDGYETSIRRFGNNGGESGTLLIRTDYRQR